MGATYTDGRGSHLLIGHNLNLPIHGVRPRMSLYISTAALKSFNGQIGISAATGTPINVRTRFDDNGDLLFNDRPAGYTRNSARGGGQWNMNGYFSYWVGFGQQTNTG